VAQLATGKHGSLLCLTFLCCFSQNGGPQQRKEVLLKLTEHFEREARASRAAAVPIEAPDPRFHLLPFTARVNEAVELAGKSMNQRREWAMNWVESQQFPIKCELIYVSIINRRYAEATRLLMRHDTNW
jgi:hypothetical protein